MGWGMGEGVGGWVLSFQCNSPGQTGTHLQVMITLKGEGYWFMVHTNQQTNRFDINFCSGSTPRNSQIVKVKTFPFVTYLSKVAL